MTNLYYRSAPSADQQWPGRWGAPQWPSTAPLPGGAAAALGSARDAGRAWHPHLLKCAADAQECQECRACAAGFRPALLFAPSCSKCEGV